MQGQKSRHSKKYCLIIWMVAGILLMSCALGGCGGEKNSLEQGSNDTAKGNRDATAEVLHPEASGEVTDRKSTRITTGPTRKGGFRDGG